MTVLLLDVAAPDWLILDGHRVMNGAQVAFLVVCLVTVNAGLAVGWLTHLARKRAGEVAATQTVGPPA